MTPLRDPMGLILAAARTNNTLMYAATQVDAELRTLRELVDVLRGLHHPEWVSDEARIAGKEPWVCTLCGVADGDWPCESVALIDEVRREA